MNNRSEAQLRLENEARKLKTQFSPYNNAHNMALGVLLMLNEDRPAVLSEDQEVFLAELLETLCVEAELPAEALQEATILNEHRQSVKEFKYAALSYISKLGHKTGWTCPVSAFQGRGFLSLMNELARIELCEAHTGKGEIEHNVAYQPQERLGTPREFVERRGEYEKQ